jgi:hypothetical protein
MTGGDAELKGLMRKAAMVKQGHITKINEIF